MFRFTIRDVLWLMVVVSLGLALWMERSRNGIARKQLQGVVDALATVDVQAEVGRNHVTITGPTFAAHWQIGPRNPKRPPVHLDAGTTRVTPSIEP